MSTQERLLELERLRTSGDYAIAKIEMLDQINNLELTSKLDSHIKYLNDVFMEYLEELMELDGHKPGMLEFLKAIRVADVEANHGLERENPFMILLYSQMSRETAMGRLIKYAKNGKELSGKDVFSIHNTLLTGTLSEGESSIRTDNYTFVGGQVNGVMEIDYFPIDYNDIGNAANALANIYNNQLSGELYNNLFIQPFLIHGLFAALQMFKDGNTRMGRIMQHALLWRNIGTTTEYNFDSPAIFATKSYYPYRKQYRDKINDLVLYGDNDAWGKWFEFNLDRLEDAIDFNKKNIHELKLRRIK